MLVRELLPLGRIGRGGFWLRHLLVLPLALFLCISAEQIVGRPLGLVAALATTLFLVSTWGRRLHDRGRSAFWLLLAALPVLGALFLADRMRLPALAPAGRALRRGAGLPRRLRDRLNGGLPETRS